MEGKRILTTRAVANMVTAEDVYTSDNRLIIPENTVLTDEIINALKEYSVFAFRVKVGEDGRTPLIKDDENSLNVSEEPEIIAPSDDIFLESYENPVSDITDLGANGERDKYYRSLKETEEFKAFHEEFIRSVDDIKDEFNSVIMRNKELDTERMLEDMYEVLGKGRNSIHILDMLQCMRGYNDVTYMHCLNVALLSNMIGSIVYPDISEKDMDVLMLSGLLCDIGKMLVPEEVLMKKDRLTLPEYNLVKTHVYHGKNILSGLGLDPRIPEVAMRHHERCDGSGYPGGYKRNQIEEFARIVAIADTYDAMTSDRVYRAAICPFDVIHMFEREGLIKYDVQFLLPFLEKAVQAYVNTDVKLSTNEIGRVIMINRKEFSRPVVQVGDSFYDLTEEKSVDIDEILL